VLSTFTASSVIEARRVTASCRLVSEDIICSICFCNDACLSAISLICLFSLKNIDLLQQGIRNKILNVTYGKINISRQSDDELKIIMRSIYFQYGQNRNINIIEQVLELNTLVIEWSVPQIISNFKQSQQYIKDISTLPEPLERSILPSTKGTKTLNITNMY